MKTQILLGVIIILICLLSCSEKSNSVDYSEEPVKIAVPFAKGIISTENNSEFSLMFTPDGRKVYFSRRTPEEKQIVMLL